MAGHSYRLPSVVVQALWLCAARGYDEHLDRSTDLSLCLGEVIGGSLKLPGFYGQAP